MRRVSHRELRNNSAEILRAVDNGESFEITNYGRVVALIVPAQPSPLDSLRAAGKTQPARSPLSSVLETDAIQVPGDTGTELDAMRSDR